jgi:hypothetical protein
MRQLGRWEFGVLVIGGDAAPALLVPALTVRFRAAQVRSNRHDVKVYQLLPVQVHIVPVGNRRQDPADGVA